MTYNAIYQSAFGPIAITHDNKNLTGLDLLSGDIKAPSPADTLTHSIIQQLAAYCQNAAFTFTIPYKFTRGTEKQQTIWHMLAQIPLGEVRSYGQLADMLQTSPRVIGNACRLNPLPIIFPCHRIVAKHHLGGFAGQRQGPLLMLKQQLLRHEGAKLHE